MKRKKTTKPSAKTCTWSQDEDGNWHTSCKEPFCIENDTPKQTGMRYCCYCGKGLEEERYKDEEDATMRGEGSDDAIRLEQNVG